MKVFCGALLGVVMILMASSGIAQSAKRATGANGASSGTRYFKLTVDLKFPESADGQVQPGDQSITTEVAVGEGKPGSCRTRMTSQLPVVLAGKTTFVELGTKFDCNDVHVEGDGLALKFVFETSRVSRMITTKDHDGVEREEPLIAKRVSELAVKLPMDMPKVVFDSKAMAGKLKPIENSPNPVPSGMALLPDLGMQVVMTASESR